MLLFLFPSFSTCHPYVFSMQVHRISMPVSIEIRDTIIFNATPYNMVWQSSKSYALSNNIQLFKIFLHCKSIE
jgi:hypothetical protein